jgi:hypothetical protein
MTCAGGKGPALAWANTVIGVRAAHIEQKKRGSSFTSGPLEVIFGIVSKVSLSPGGVNTLVIS